MKKLSPIFVIPLMLLGAFLVPTVVHAQTGIVSINGGSPVTAQPSDTTVSVPIQISGSDLFSGFDVMVVADPTILQGASVSLAGSIVPSPSILVECINGVLVAGTSCAPQDTLGVVHLAAANTVAQQSSTGTGLVFTINYNIVGSSSGSPLTFSTGCSGTSVPGVCVTIANASGALPETAQGSSFANEIDFSMTPVFSKLSTPAGVSINDNINYATIGPYMDLVDQSVTTDAGLTCSITPATVDLTFPTATGTLMCSAAVNGLYHATVKATGEGLFTPSVPVVTHSVTIPVLVASPDFTLALSQHSVTINRGSSDASTMVNLEGFSSFSGTVSISCTCASGITATAAMSTLTPDGSGYSTASPALTISVASSVATGNYLLTIMGNDASHSDTITVMVPGQDFSINAVPNDVSINRGGSVALDLNLESFGNFAGTITFTTTITNQGTDSCCFTNNITPSYSPATATLTAGGSTTVFFFASTVGGNAPPSTYTATGNYTAIVTATSGSISHSATVTFNVEDFSLGPSFCTGNNFVQTSPDSLSATVFGVDSNGFDFAGQTIGTPCSSLTITDQPNILTPYLSIFSSPAQVLWVQDNALGGLITDGFNGLPSVSVLNGDLPFNGILVPQMHAIFGAASGKACMVPTFWANGTQIPYSYLAQNGPLILPSSGLYPFLAIIGVVGPGTSNWGCRFDSATYPRDVGNAEVGGLNDATGSNYQNINNPDFYGVTAMALQGTLPGDYTFKLCPQAGVILHCSTFGLTVLSAPTLHQLVVKKSVSFSGSGGVLAFKIGISNPSTHTVFAQGTLTGIGSFGDTFSVTTAEVTIAPGANANNLAFTVPLTSSMIGESFTFSISIIVGTDPNNLTGTSTEQSIQRTVTITP